MDCLWDTNLDVIDGLWDTNLDPMDGLWNTKPSSNALQFNTEGLDNEPDMMAMIQGQEETHPNQNSSGEHFLGDSMEGGSYFSAIDDGYSMAEFMNDYDGASSLSPLPLQPEGYFEDIDSSSPSLLEERAGASPSRDRFNTTNQHMMERHTKLRVILPRSIETAAVHVGLGDPPSGRSEEKKPKKSRPYDVAREKRKITKPVSCHLCHKSSSSRKDLKRHHAVWHRDYAASIGIPIERNPCPELGCKKTYTRLDNLNRHLKKNHMR